MKLQQGVQGDANPLGLSRYRYWLTRTWAEIGQMALVVGINPNTATEAVDDGMTIFLTRLLQPLGGVYACRGYILVNCCDIRHSDPRKVEELEAPCSASNFTTIQRLLKRCDYVVASWGTTDYGETIRTSREAVAELVSHSKKKVICFSPKGLPIYCSQTSANSRDGRWR